jgi:hypothetical protein
MSSAEHRIAEDLLSARGDVADVVEDMGIVAGLIRQAYESMYAKERVGILKEAVDMTQDLMESAASLKSTLEDILDLAKEVARD